MENGVDATLQYVKVRRHYKVTYVPKSSLSTVGGTSGVLAQEEVFQFNVQATCLENWEIPNMACTDARYAQQIQDLIDNPKMPHVQAVATPNFVEQISFWQVS